MWFFKNNFKENTFIKNTLSNDTAKRTLNITIYSHLTTYHNHNKMMIKLSMLKF